MVGTPRLNWILFALDSLATLALSVVAKLVSAWWLFPVGLLVSSVARLPVLRMSRKLENRAPLAQRFQRYFHRVQRAQVSVFNSLSSAPADTRRTLNPVQVETDSLAEQVYSLCRSMTTLENYRVVASSESQPEAELKRIDDVLATTDDPLIKKEYGESRYSLEQRISKRDEISRQLDRVEAQLVSLANAMDSTVAEVIRLQALGAEEAQNQVPALVDRLRQQSAELAAFGRGTVRL